MSIFRVVKDENYFQVHNEPFNDDTLSWEARGMLGYLLSKPNDWAVRTNDLIKRSPAGRKKTQRIINELKERGYMRRFAESDGRGGIRWVTEVYERKALNPDQSFDGPLSCPVKKSPDVEGGHLVITEDNQILNGNTDEELFSAEDAAQEKEPARVSGLPAEKKGTATRSPAQQSILPLETPPNLETMPHYTNGHNEAKEKKPRKKAGSGGKKGWDMDKILILRKDFCELTGIPDPDPQTAREYATANRRWNEVLWGFIVYAGTDLEYARRLLRAAIKHAQDNAWNIYTPQSIVTAFDRVKYELPAPSSSADWVTWKDVNGHEQRLNVAQAIKALDEGKRVSLPPEVRALVEERRRERSTAPPAQSPLQTRPQQLPIGNLT